MKKKFLLLLFFLIPLNIYAYSSKVIPGGENIGIYVKEKGIMIVGFYSNLNNYLKIGDQIIKVNNHDINTIDDLINIIKSEVDDGDINITYIRNNTEYQNKLYLTKQNGVYKTGLYIKDNTTGIGTLTYIDPNTNIFGSLGHEIINSTTKTKIEVADGYIFQSNITSIKKSRDGNPGGKMANFNNNIIYGKINKNTNVGIYGIYDQIPEKELIEVGNPADINLGEAYILTTLNNNQINKYKINIIKINKQSATKNIYFEIIDQELLKETGGIVQGMSGSPIIQNDKIIGAVTHVLVDAVKSGYGIFITTMLNEGEK